jgi:hypothetical protein
MQELFLFIFDCNFCQDSNGAEPSQDCDMSYFVFHGSNVSERLLVSRYFFHFYSFLFFHASKRCARPWFELFRKRAKSRIVVFKKCAKYFLCKSFNANHLRARGAPKSLTLKDLRAPFKIGAPSAFSLAVFSAFLRS